MDSDVASTRIAGVMVLAEIADTYRGNYRQSVVDILCGYLRTWHREEEKGHDAAVESAILSVIATHVKEYREIDGKSDAEQILEGDQLWCDCQFDFHNAVFIESVNFEGTRFARSVNFRGAEFTEGADFFDVRFVEYANFEEVEFTGKIQFERVEFTENASFTGVEFTGDTIFLITKFAGDATFPRSEFAGDASFSDTDIRLAKSTGLPSSAIRKTPKE